MRDTGPRSQDGTTASPADDLADVWNMLDTLPTANPAADLTATTVELVAARVVRDTRDKSARSPRTIDRVLPLVVIVGGFIFGMAVGRGTMADPDQRILERLPVIEHMGLLQEAGSVEFLEAVAEKMKAGQGNAPRWVKFKRDSLELRPEAQEFDRAIDALQAEFAGGESSRDELARRRDRVASLSPSDLAVLEKSSATFDGLPAVDRRDVERLARTLADPAQTSLHDAAKLWHVIITTINPLVRRNIVEMPTADRLEWLAHSAGRFDPRMPNRPGDLEPGGKGKPPAPRSEKEWDRGTMRGPGQFQRPPSGTPGDGSFEGPDRRPNPPPFGGPPGSPKGGPDGPLAPPPRGDQ